jgi:hypothetical protein
MSEAARQAEKESAGRRAAGEWAGIEDTAEVMSAMVLMYDLTHDRMYLDHLRELSHEVLKHRDDRRDPPPVDQFTRRVMRAWGASHIAAGSLHHADMFDAGLWSYPIAAFARIVVESPELHADYGADAIAFANATAETLLDFVHELDAGPDGTKRFVNPESYRTLLTQSRCKAAYDEAVAGGGPEGGIISEEDGLERLNVLYGLCKSAHRLAGRPRPHNKAHAFEMAMIETWRAVDSAFHRERETSNLSVNWARGIFPDNIKRTFEWFERNLRRVDEDPTGWFVWNYADDVLDIRIEDTSHGNLSMRYVGVLHRSLESVNKALVAAGQDPIDLSELRRRLANTFISKVGAGRDLAQKVNGESPGGKDPDYYNRTCSGWLDLAQVDTSIYDKCREVVLRVVDVVEDGVTYRRQKYLTTINHAALLFNKPRGGPPTTVPDVVGETVQNAAAAIRAAQLLPSFTGPGWVESQQPEPGVVLDGGNVVLCQTRTGPIPGPDQTRVPDVRNSLKEEAADAITRAGLVPSFRGSGTWVRFQDPPPEEVVNLRTRVACVLGGGRLPPDPPL